MDDVSFHIGSRRDRRALWRRRLRTRADRPRAGRALHPILGGADQICRRILIARASPADALASRVGFLPSDRKQEGILPNRSIRENLMLSNLRAVARCGCISNAPSANVTAAIAQLETLGVKYASAEHVITTLSGGNQQKVLFGRALSARPKLLVLEDPTAGHRYRRQAGSLWHHSRSHAAEGMSLLLDVQRSHRNAHAVRSRLCHV